MPLVNEMCPIIQTRFSFLPFCGCIMCPAATSSYSSAPTQPGGALRMWKWSLAASRFMWRGAVMAAVLLLEPPQSTATSDARVGLAELNNSLDGIVDGCGSTWQRTCMRAHCPHSSCYVDKSIHLYAMPYTLLNHFACLTGHH